MKKNSENSIDDQAILKADSPPLSQNFNQQLHDTHRVFVQTLNPNLKIFFEGLNDFFFDRAEQAENNQLQNQYFTAIGDIRKNQTELIRQFTKNVNVIFQKFKTRDFIYFIDSQAKADTKHTHLTLIKEDDLDQKLAINNVIAKISQVYHEALYLLNERFTHILNEEHEIDVHSNPIGPDAMVNAFALSLKVLKSGNNIKLMIIKLFEKEMVEGLGPAYNKVNKYLKKSGVLPDIKLVVKQQSKSSHTINNSINYLAHALSEEDESYKKIAEILAHDREQAPQHNYSAENIVQFSQLTDALDQIKAELFTDQELESKQSISPLALKDELINKLKSLKALSNHHQITDADENTIDLIGQMFQFLVEDRDLPESIQLVLSKLQLPYLQIALKDQTFFSDKHNNARQLLNIMAKCSVGWSPEVDDQGIFLSKVKEIVQFILENHEKNINYEKLIQRFIQFDQKLRKRALITERRTYEKISGRERLLHAKTQTAQFLRTQLKGQTLPPVVREVLLKPWANVLILSELRQQDSPELLQNNQDFVVRLVQAANPQSKQKLSTQAIAQLCEEMSEGLKLVAFDPRDLKVKSMDIQSCLESINGDTQTLGPDDYIDPVDILKLSKEFNQDSSVGELLSGDTESGSTASDGADINDEFTQAVKDFGLGEWLEIDAQDKPQRVKLSWVSPISGKLLFVNAKGAKVIDLYPAELAGKLRTGQFRIMQQVPILDRALSSIAAKMKKQTTVSET